jgi:hypothetical protein
VTSWSARRPRKYRAPTWSWASLDERVVHHYTLNPEILHHWTLNADITEYRPGYESCMITLIEARVDVLGADSTGQLKGSHLRVLGIMRPCHLFSITKQDDALISLDMMSSEVGNLAIGNFPVKVDAFLDVPDEVGGHVQLYCLPVFHWWDNSYTGLILRRGVAPGTFERVGLFENRVETSKESMSSFVLFILMIFQIPDGFFESSDPEKRWKTIISQEYAKGWYSTCKVPEYIEGLESIQPQEIVIV